MFFWRSKSAKRWALQLSVAACTASFAGGAGCSTTETPPEAPVAPVPPLLAVPHPAGSDLSDIRDLFFDRQAPTLDSLKTCDADFRKLQQATQSRAELGEGLEELVRKDPVHYHWCFYGKILSLETALKGELYIEERQKRVLDAFEFLTPVARSFLTEFHDSRYLRWAIVRYEKLSEWVFFRKVEPSPKETDELVNAANPLGLVRGGEDKSTILDRYNISGAPPAVQSSAPGTAPAPTDPAREPAAVPADPVAMPAIEGPATTVPTAESPPQTAPAK